MPDTDDLPIAGKDPSHLTFRDLGLERLNVKKRVKEIANHRLKERRKNGEPELTTPKALSQALIWDEGCEGLCLLISSGGTKTFRCTFKLHGKWIMHTLGRYPVLGISEARR